MTFGSLYDWHLHHLATEHITGPPHRALIDFLMECEQRDFETVEAVMWLGRGDFSSFDRAFRHAQAASKGGEREDGVSYVVGKARLAEHLRAGQLLLVQDTERRS